MSFFYISYTYVPCLKSLGQRILKLWTGKCLEIISEYDLELRKESRYKDNFNHMTS